MEPPFNRAMQQHLGDDDDIDDDDYGDDDDGDDKHGAPVQSFLFLVVFCLL